MSTADRMRQLLESLDVNKAAADFLAVIPANRVEISKRALSVLLPAYEAGEIFNVDFKDNKAILDRSFEEAWRALTQLDYTTYWADPEDKSKGISVRGQINDALDSYVSGVRNAISISKKLAKAAKTFKDPYIDQLKTLVDGALPLANILEVLKTKTIKGRKPAPPEKQAAKAAQLAKKDMKTCACCFRTIARLPNGFIADHGYSLPNVGFKTSSCPGRKFKPLEVSDDGLKYMVDFLQRREKDLEKTIKDFPKRTKLNVRTYSKKIGDEIGPTDPRWNSTYNALLGQFKSELDYTSKSLKTFQDKLRGWKPTIVESIGTLAGQLRSLIDD